MPGDVVSATEKMAPIGWNRWAQYSRETTGTWTWACSCRKGPPAVGLCMCVSLVVCSVDVVVQLSVRRRTQRESFPGTAPSCVVLCWAALLFVSFLAVCVGWAGVTRRSEEKNSFRISEAGGARGRRRNDTLPSQSRPSDGCLLACWLAATGVS